MGNLGVDLARMLHFNPGWVTDPPPWLLQVLEREQIFEIARIHIEFQRAVEIAHSKALGELEKVVSRGLKAPGK